MTRWSAPVVGTVSFAVSRADGLRLPEQRDEAPEPPLDPRPTGRPSKTSLFDREQKLRATGFGDLVFDPTSRIDAQQYLVDCELRARVAGGSQRFSIALGLANQCFELAEALGFDERALSLASAMVAFAEAENLRDQLEVARVLFESKLSRLRLEIDSLRGVLGNFFGSGLEADDPESAFLRVGAACQYLAEHLSRAHPHVQFCRARAGLFAARMGRFRVAYDLLEESRQYQDSAHPDVPSLVNLSIVCRQLGLFQHALERGQEALGHLSRLESESPAEVGVRSNLALVHRSMGQLERAHQMAQQAVDIAERTGDLRLSTGRSALINLAQIQLDLNLKQRAQRTTLMVEQSMVDAIDGVSANHRAHLHSLLGQLASEPTDARWHAKRVILACEDERSHICARLRGSAQQSLREAEPPR